MRTSVLCLMLLALLAGACQPAAQPPAERSAPSAPAAAAPAQPAAPVAPAAPATAEPRPRHQVKVGVLAPNQGAAGIYIALDRGYFAEQGLDVELVPFTRGPEMVPPLSTNQIQVGTGGAGPGLFNAVSQGIYNKVVADEGSTQPNAGGFGVVYRRDLHDSGLLTRPEQLAGKSIAISGLDSVTELWIMTNLVPHFGLAPTDVTLVPVPFPDQATALANRTVDAAVPIEPFASTIVARDLGVRGITAGDLTPGLQVAVIVYSEEFARNREVANAWMVGYVRGMRDHEDALIRKRTPPDTVLAILERFQAIPSRDAVKDMTLFALNPNGYVYQDNLIAMHDYFVRKGSIKQPVAISELVDNSFVDHAIRALGEYR